MDRQQLLAILATILLTGSDISTSMEDEEKRGSGYSVKGAVEMAAEILEKAETYALTPRHRQ